MSKEEGFIKYIRDNATVYDYKSLDDRWEEVIKYFKEQEDILMKGRKPLTQIDIFKTMMENEQIQEIFKRKKTRGYKASNRH